MLVGDTAQAVLMCCVLLAAWVRLGLCWGIVCYLKDACGNKINMHKIGLDHRRPLALGDIVCFEFTFSNTLRIWV